MAGGKKSKGLSQRKPKSSVSQKKPAFHTGNASTNPSRPLPDNKKAGFYRTKATINRLNMYNTKVDFKKRREQPSGPSRMAPDRRWFENTRVITQSKLEAFRQQMADAANDPYSVVLKRSKLPIPLLQESTKTEKMNLLTIEPFDSTFGSKKTRKRPKLSHGDIEALVDGADLQRVGYNEEKDTLMLRTDDGSRKAVSEEVFNKGTSKRIWQELYKVVDSSDVIIQVLDARDPMGTRCQRLEKHFRKDRAHKHLVLLLNKCDLIPSWATAQWVKVLGREYPTLAFHASITNPFGKNSLIQLLRQFGKLLKDRKHVSVGFIGYPNVGKSSVINTLKKKKVCKAAPTPGETRVWQYINLTNRVYLIDCPGVVPNDEASNDDTSKVLKGAVRAERLQCPEDYVEEVLRRVKREYILNKYKLTSDVSWEDSEEFLKILAVKMGKLRKGGEPDLAIAARIVIYDWQRGRLPSFVCPPFKPHSDEAVETKTPTEEEIDNQNASVS
eukprot:GHVQ01017704.1.p1 GENE.GHVQ01017704.1~~GHVQ01017704.1.p1  ORF type:complete len:499 (+),score=57.40 GHVQ01017704.1:4969-6465(+)